MRTATFRTPIPPCGAEAGDPQEYAHHVQGCQECQKGPRCYCGQLAVKGGEFPDVCADWPACGTVTVEKLRDGDVLTVDGKRVVVSGEARQPLGFGTYEFGCTVDGNPGLWAAHPGTVFQRAGVA